MDGTDESWEIARDLTRKQYLTLAAIRSAGGEAQTADVTSSSEELYNELVNTHFRKMIDAGLLESVDRDGSDSSSAPPRKGYTYRITDRGREVHTAAQEDYGFDPLQEGAIREHFDRIEERLESVEQEVQGQHEGDDGIGDLEVGWQRLRSASTRLRRTRTFWWIICERWLTSSRRLAKRSGSVASERTNNRGRHRTVLKRYVGCYTVVSRRTT